MDAWLHQMRQLLVAEARGLFVNPDYDTVTLDLPLPSSSYTADNEGISREEKKSVAKENGQSLQQEAQSLDWGTEGEEGPLLAFGEPNLCGLLKII